MTTQATNGRAWLIWGLGALFFFSMYIPRVATGVLTPYLMDDFAVGAGAIGTLTSFYFYPYLVMQIPVGYFVDRFGPRILLTIMIAMCGLSSLLFAYADNFVMAELSRAVLGLGAAFAFVGALKLAAEWFPASKIGLLTGLTQSLGMLGAMVGEYPTEISVVRFGWRDTMVGISIMFFILAALVGLIVRDKPNKKEHFHVEHKTGEGGIWAEFCSVLTNPQSWLNGLFGGLLFAPTAAFAEQWGNYYLQVVYDFHDVALGISLIFAGFALGGPVMGWLSSRMGRRKPMMFVSAISSFVLFSLVLYLPMPRVTLYTLLFCFGVMNTGLVVSYALATEINPHRVAGTSLAIANMMSVILGAAFQPLIGFLMDFFAKRHETIANSHYAHSISDVKSAMLVLPGCLIVACFMIFFIKETHCKPFEAQ